MTTILGIETSCDETAAAVVRDGRILSNVVASQIKIHVRTGGVVPEVAARAHVERILPVISEALLKAKLDTISDVTAIAVTAGPGLLGSLIVGTETAKTLAYVFNKPIIPINHLEGHIISAFAEKLSIINYQLSIHLPALALIVSGGHTELVLIKKPFDYKVIGRTRDDAAGEAFDKIAKLLDLGYPGGPAIAAEAAKFRIKNQESRIKLPRPMVDSDDFDFSFSGLKTAVLYYLKKNPNANKAMIAHEAQEAIVDVLVKKTLSAAQKYKVKTILLGGGVSANEELCKRFLAINNYQLAISPVPLTTDNAAMIALAGYLRYLDGQRQSWYDVRVDPHFQLS